MEALRYPEDFDGIISGAPDKDQSAVMIYFAWVIRQNTGKDGKDIISSEDMDLIIKKNVTKLIVSKTDLLQNPMLVTHF